MADQVIPTGGLAPGLLSALVSASPPRIASTSSRSTDQVDSSVSGAEDRPISASSRKSDFASGREQLRAPQAAVDELNSYLKQTGTDLKFQVDKATGRTVFKIVSQDNGEVLLQVPSEEMLAMARKLRELAAQTDASGVLMDKEG